MIHIKPVDGELVFLIGDSLFVASVDKDRNLFIEPVYVNLQNLVQIGGDGNHHRSRHGKSK